MSPPDDMRLPTRDELFEELLRFSEINPHRQKAIQIASQIRGLQAMRHLGEMNQASDLSAVGEWLAFEATPKDLRILADIIDRSLTELPLDARRSNIVQSWFAAVALKRREPTLADVKECFLIYFDRRMLPSNYSMRKTLKLLGLNLSKGKLGRPKGSRSQIGNPRRVEQ